MMKSPMTPPSTAATAGGHRYYESDSDGDDSSSQALQPQQFFDGPLLSVKEYRDKLTGDVRYRL